MTRAKQHTGRGVTDSTPLVDVHGWGPQAFTVLATMGYKLTSKSTVQDFRAETGSLSALQSRLSERGVAAKYVLPKFKKLWGLSSQPTAYSGVGQSRADQSESIVQERQGGPNTTLAQTASGQSHGQDIQDPGQSTAKDVISDRRDEDVNFMLGPKVSKPQSATDTSKHPDIVTSIAETPEVDALRARHAADGSDDPTRTPVPGQEGKNPDAAGESKVLAASVDPFVVPDQLQALALPDKDINAPLVVLEPSQSVPPAGPAIAIGEHVFASRMIPPLTAAQTQAQTDAHGELPHVKANGQKDIGGDGYGSLTYNALLSDNQADPSHASASNGGNQQKRQKFKSVPLQINSEAKDTTSINSNPDSTHNPQDQHSGASQPDPVHPFRQPKAFQNHGLQPRQDTPVIMQYQQHDSRRLKSAMKSTRGYRDDSWRRWNAATQGVDSVDMPQTANNFLGRGQMTSEYQLLGAQNLQHTFSPCSYTASRVLGAFGTTAGALRRPTAVSLGRTTRETKPDQVNHSVYLRPHLMKSADKPPAQYTYAPTTLHHNQPPRKRHKRRQAHNPY